MYYYILESPPTRAVKQSYSRLRDILNFLGISGEFVIANPARNPEELAKMAIEKGYTTVVAVGGDKTINEVARTILGQAALGIIPIGASEQIYELIGARDLKEAAEALKYRKLISVGTVYVEPDKILFLDTVIQSSRHAKMSMVVDNRTKVAAYFNKIVITRDLEIHVYGEFEDNAKHGFLGALGFGKKTYVSKSSFHGKQVRITTEPALKIYSGEDVIGTTPINLRLIPESLKIITSRGKIL